MSATMVRRIIDMARQRGFTFAVVGGQPVLRGNPAFMTDPLRRAVAEFRGQIIEFLKLDAIMPAPASEPDTARNVRVMDAFGQTAVVCNFGVGEWKVGNVAWQYIGEAGWHPIVGREDKFPTGIAHA